MSDYGIEAATKEEWAERALRAEAKLERIEEAWEGALYGALENGVAPLNAAAVLDFCKRYPSISSFGNTLMEIILEGEK